MVDDYLRMAKEENLALLDRMRKYEVTSVSGAIETTNLLSQAISFWDEDLCFVEANNSFYDKSRAYTNIADDALLGMPLEEVYPNLDQLALGRICDGTQSSFTTENYMPIGHRYDHECYGIVTISKTSNFIVVIASDITEYINIQNTIAKNENTLQVLTEDEHQLDDAFDALLQDYSSVASSIQVSYASSLEGLLIPLLSLLEQSQLDEKQRAAVTEGVNEIGKLLSNTSSSLGLSEALSARERQVAQLTKMGKTTREISQILCLSTKTVDTHRASIRRKLGIERNTNLYLYLNKHEL